MHNAAAGMQAEILAGREIPHATVIAFSRGGRREEEGEGTHTAKTTTTFAIPNGSIYRPIAEISFAFSILFAPVRCANRRLYACIDTVLPVIPSYQNHRPSTELIYHLVESCVSLHKRFRTFHSRVCRYGWSL